MSTSSSTQQRHADKIDHVFQGLKSQNLSFGRFVQGVLNSKNSEIKAVVTKWLRLSNSIEESIGGVEDSARKFGPEDVLDALVAEVNNRSDSAGVKRLNQALMAHARPLMVQEVEHLCANGGQWLRVPSTNVVECSRLHQSLSPLADFYRNKLPSLFQFLSMLIGKTQDKQEGDAVHQDDVAQQEEAPGALSEEEKPTIRSTLESISDMAVPNAKELFADKNRIKVFLFDNINIYMRRAALRLTDFNTAAALTMRTIYTLSSSCLPSDFTEGHIRQLRDADRALLTVEDIVPDGDFLEQAGIIHIAQSLMGCAQFQPRQQSAVLRRLEELRRLHTIDVLEPEVTTFVSLKLLREDEGTLEGIKTVFTDTLQELGLDATMEPLLVAGDLLSVRNTLAVQDAGKFEDEGSVHRLDKVWPISGPWHMLQSWLYLIFKTHFAASKSGKDGCLDRVREILRRGRTALREDKPLFNEAWEFGQEVWEGRLQAMLESVYIVLQLLNLEHDPT
ncbi:unnamed protein product [Tilletia caries]|uniref:DUF6589 domain-containing protein n=1 Tax=Tilletia caries TaxID=13290 RepID=A0ABN7J099_9BASI|nr:unnamed protein product [Tilletia caries]